MAGSKETQLEMFEGRLKVDEISTSELIYALADVQQELKRRGFELMVEYMRLPEIKVYGTN